MSTQPRAWVNLGMHGEYSEMRCRAKVVHPICPQSLVREYNQGQVSLMVHQTRPDQTWNPKPSSRDHHDNYRGILKEYKQNKKKWMGKNNNKPRVSKSGDKLISWLTDLNVRGCKRASECLTFKLQTDSMLSLWSVSRLHPFQYIHTHASSPIVLGQCPCWSTDWLAVWVDIALLGPVWMQMQHPSSPSMTTWINVVNSLVAKHFIYDFNGTL